MLVDHHQVDNVARLAPSCRRHDFVGGKVDGMQHVTKKLILV
jgi:hypothetical protein